MADTEQEKPTQAPKQDSGDESEDECEVLEESPCGRWQKRREEVRQRDVPGIDIAFLAMDTEEGMEVVWNEVQFSENKRFRAQQDKIRQVFDNLIQLEHPNIVKFHKYWTDATGEKPRVVFITEYMSSGSLKQFLKRTKKNNKTFPLKAWKKWCTQILSALTYLHSCDPPIIHGNLTCDTVFIQHNGLIKIGSVAPDAINLHVKTYRENMKNMHCFAPEYGGSKPVTTKVDIHSLGMCALEMAALEIQGNGEGTTCATQDAITNTLESLENEQQRNFIRSCIHLDPEKRPSARDLLFHAILFEVHSLRLLAAHAFASIPSILAENMTDDAYLAKTDPNTVIAEIKSTESRETVQWKFSQIQGVELEKFLEDVKNGIYPLTAFALPQPPPSRPRAATPEVTESVKSETPEPIDVETRKVMNMHCQVKRSDDGVNTTLVLMLRMDDKMNRQLQCDISCDDNSSILAEELVHYGFINEHDKDKIATLMDEHLKINPPIINGTCSPILVA